MAGRRASKMNPAANASGATVRPPQLGSTGRPPQPSANQPFAPSPHLAHSRAHAAVYQKQNQRRRLRKRIAIVVSCVLVTAVVGVGTAGALMIQSIDSSLSGNGKQTEEQQMAIQEQLVETTTYDEPFYMMLIGSDRRADDASMGARSDTNILVRVDAPNNLVTMVSIPRDTMTDIDGAGTAKFNAIYNYDGAAGVIREASQLCGVEIAHYAEVNFEELIALIDAIGGVEIDVPYRIDDPDAGSIVIEPGPQTLDGEAALVFARTRQFADGDFTRTSNQRMLIEAVVNKVFTMNPLELPGTIQRAAESVITDMSVMDIFSLVTQFRDAGNLTMYSAMVPSYTENVPDAAGNLISYVKTDSAGLRSMMRIIEEGGDPNEVQAMGAIGSSVNENHTLELTGEAADGEGGDADPSSSANAASASTSSGADAPSASA